LLDHPLRVWIGALGTRRARDRCRARLATLCRGSNVLGGRLRRMAF
jgi:hypothetical protein